MVDIAGLKGQNPSIAASSTTTTTKDSKAVSVPANSASVSASTAATARSCSVHSLFLDTQHVQQSEALLDNTLSSLMGGGHGEIRDLDAKEHVFHLLEQFHTPLSLKNKLRIL